MVENGMVEIALPIDNRTCLECDHYKEGKCQVPKDKWCPRHCKEAIKKRYAPLVAIPGDVDIVEVEKNRLRRFFLQHGNNMSYEDVLNTYDGLCTDALEDLLHVMVNEGDIFQPSMDLYSMVV